MNRSVSLSALAAAVLFATISAAAAQQSEIQYVEVGRDFRQAEHVTMGTNLLTPDEQRRFDTIRKAKTRAERNRIEAQETALLNQRVSERVTAALSQTVAPMPPSTAETPRDMGPRTGPGGM